jgi:hypothetical protein
MNGMKVSNLDSASMSSPTPGPVVVELARSDAHYTVTMQREDSAAILHENGSIGRRNAGVPPESVRGCEISQRVSLQRAARHPLAWTRSPEPSGPIRGRTAVATAPCAAAIAITTAITTTAATIITIG